MPKINPKKNSSIRAGGAESYVQAILMLEFGILTSLASRNMPNFDAIAHNLKKRIDCKISIKYRKATNSDGFRFTKIEDFDIFVGVLGQRGKIGMEEDKSQDLLAECFIFSKREVKGNIIDKKKYLLLPRKTLTKKRKNAWFKILKCLQIKS